MISAMGEQVIENKKAGHGIRAGLCNPTEQLLFLSVNQYNLRPGDSPVIM